MGSKNLILTNSQIENKIRRICYEIYETNYEQKEIVLFGIVNKGFLIAEQIAKQLRDISPLKIELQKAEIKKSIDPRIPDVYLSYTNLENKSVCIIDDVLNTGFTLAHVLKEVMNYPVKEINTVVLIDRKHRKFPVRANIVGLTLSSTLEDHIEVVFNKNKMEAFLV